MKILIIGEYSSLAYNLKKGLLELGEDVSLVNFGDGWKKIDVIDENDYQINTYISKNIKIFDKEIKGSWRVKELKRVLYYLLITRKKIKEFFKTRINYYDIVFILNQEFVAVDKTHMIFHNAFIELNDILMCKKADGKIYLGACGDDSIYLDYCNNFKYNPYDNGYFRKKYKNNIDRSNLKKLMKNLTAVIPNSYDYAKAYKESKLSVEIKDSVRFPMYLERGTMEIFNKKNQNKKIKIFHGLNREEFKGTKYIKKALENISKKYQDRVEVEILGGLPLEVYLQKLDEADIVIDQCKSYGYGMNALYALKLGKVVLSGSEKEALKELKIENSPVINIVPDEKQIEEEIEKLILEPKLIEQKKIEGVIFLEKYHDAKKVAKQYLDIWSGKV